VVDKVSMDQHVALKVIVKQLMITSLNVKCKMKCCKQLLKIIY
jgi:hypothetical protein